jgi:hypothetical protein
MSRGHGAVERFVLEYLAAETARIGWVTSMDVALSRHTRRHGDEDDPSRAEVESVRRALRSLERQGLARRDGWTDDGLPLGHWRWCWVSVAPPNLAGTTLNSEGAEQE